MEVFLALYGPKSGGPLGETLNLEEVENNYPDLTADAARRNALGPGAARLFWAVVCSALLAARL